MAILAILNAPVPWLLSSVPIDGGIQNVSQATQNAYKAIWGSTLGEASQHLKEKTDLREIHAGEKVYDLADPEQLEMYLKDMGDGCLDGEMNERSIDIYVKDGKVTVTKDDGGEVVYNLADPADVLKMQKDNADGRIDGRISKKPNRATSGNTENASGADGTGAAQKPGGKDGAGSSNGPKAAGNDEGHDVTTSESGNKAGGTDGGKSPAEKEGEAANELYRKGMDAIAGYDPEQLMAMQREGRLPPEVVASPAAMTALQARIMAYHEMIQMISQQLKMDHDIKMAIIRNMSA
jgi:hypothetical protein